MDITSNPEMKKVKIRQVTKPEITRILTTEW